MKSFRQPLLLGTMIVLLITGCAGRAAAPKVEMRPLAGLVLECSPETAEIFVDDRYVGTARMIRGRALMLRPGARRIEIRSPGYFAAYRDLRMVEGVRQRLQITLRKRPF